eukprot:CFRG4745T1
MLVMALSKNHVSSLKQRYVVVGGIPEDYKSIDLRVFFSDMVEAGFFTTFHYQHRKEPKSKHNTKSCMVTVSDKHLKQLKRYVGSVWHDRNEVEVDQDATTVMLTLVKLIDKTVEQMEETREDLPQVEIPKSMLPKITELHPPRFLPNGNVGTPIKVLQQLIDECNLPPSIIRRLELNTRRTTRIENRGLKYTDVRMKYPELNISPYDYEELYRNEHPIDDEDEEWDRYEALHDDVDEQARTKERTFEENVEVTWDKGSSGLVFYTDSQYWQANALEEADVNDWDADMRISQNNGWALKVNSSMLDHNTRQRMQILERDIERNAEVRETDESAAQDETATLEMGVGTLSQRQHNIKRKNVISSPTPTPPPIPTSTQKPAAAWKAKIRDTYAPFESHTKGIGSSILFKSGWRPGMGLGKPESRGVTTAIEAVGQLSHEHYGLGFSGEGDKNAGYDIAYVDVIQNQTQRSTAHSDTATNVGVNSAITEDEKNNYVRNFIPNEQPKSKLLLPPGYVDIPWDKSEDDVDGRYAVLPETSIEQLSGDEKGYSVKYRTVDFVGGKVLEPTSNLDTQGHKNSKTSHRHAGTQTYTSAHTNAFPSNTGDVRPQPIFRPGPRYSQPYYTSQGPTTKYYNNPS